MTAFSSSSAIGKLVVQGDRPMCHNGALHQIRPTGTIDEVFSREQCRNAVGEEYGSATISCINSTNSCNFCLLVDFLHHPTFPPRRKLRGFFCLTRTRRGQLQIVSVAQTLSRVVSDSNSGLITNSLWTGQLISSSSAARSCCFPSQRLSSVPNRRHCRAWRRRVQS